MDDEQIINGKTVEKLNIQPPASIYGTFARYNYKMWYAIAEFVDNSTASFYKNEQPLKFIKEDSLVVEIEYDQNSETLAIKDNAYGMELKDFRRAILLDSRPENNDGRNEFGMGLKTAASWFGKVWSVTSTQYGSPNRYSATVNIPVLEKQHVNDVDIVKSDADIKSHGTTVRIEHLNRTIEGPRTVAKIKDIIRSMYRRDLATGKITILYNHEPLQFKPYQVLTYKEKEWRENIDFYFDFDHIVHHVTGFVGLLGTDDSGFKKAGFALFRRDRVVVGSEGDYYKPLRIFGEAQSKISHKLFGEINLEDIQINQAKDGFVWDDGLEDVFVEQLRVQIQDYIRLANKTVKERENTFDPNDKKQIEVVKEDTQSSLDRLMGGEGEKQTDREDENSTPEEKEYETLFGVNSPDPNEEIYKDTTTEYQVPTGRGTETIKVTWTSAGSSYWFSYSADESEIKINIAHPFFKPFCASTDFRNVLNKFVIAIVLAEQKAQDGSENPGYAYVVDINNCINDILKILAK